MSSAHPPVTRILALRHGESEWNAVGRWQGQEDPPLTETGLLQALTAAQQLGYTNVRHYAPGIEGWTKSGAKLDRG